MPGEVEVWYNKLGHVVVSGSEESGVRVVPVLC